MILIDFDWKHKKVMKKRKESKGTDQELWIGIEITKRSENKN